MTRITLYILLILTVVAVSCRKDAILTDSSAKLNFSVDTVMFDTVFSTVGSTTHQLRVYNSNKKRINISTLTMMKDRKHSANR